MSPITRSMSRAASLAKEESPIPEQFRDGEESENNGTESGSDWDSSTDNNDDDQDSPIIRSPTGLSYRIDQISASAQSAMRENFNDPPTIALQKCRRIDDTYAFQMTEQLTRSVRMRAGDGGKTRLSCSCGENTDFCGHILWFLDQLADQTLYEHDRSRPLRMKEEGYPEELGDPFHAIASHHLDVLAEDLHCRVISAEPDSDDVVDATWTWECRQLLASLLGVSPQDFRPDIFAQPRRRNRILKHQDLEFTMFSMLMDNHLFLQYFSSLFGPAKPTKDMFRKLLHRVDHVLHNFDEYRSNYRMGQQPTARDPTESACNVNWASAHLLGCVRLIRSSVCNREHLLQPLESVSACRTLVYILSAVTNRNQEVHNESSQVGGNLYLQLIGNGDCEFVIAELDLLPAASAQFLNELGSTLESIVSYGAPASYIDKFSNLLASLRSRVLATGSKRQSQERDTERGRKRMQ